MIVQFEFASSFRAGAGPGAFAVSLDGEGADVEAAVAALFDAQPDLFETLRRKGHIRDGKLAAMFVARDRLLQARSPLWDGAIIKVLAPICGG